MQKALVLEAFSIYPLVVNFTTIISHLTSFLHFSSFELVRIKYSRILLFTFYFGIQISAFGQDQIILKNDSIIECKILRSGKNKISYFTDNSYYRASDHKTLKVKHIKGVINGQPSTKDSLSYAHWFGRRKNALKFSLVSPLVNTVALSFEKTNKITRSIEYELGLIGLIDTNPLWDSQGFYLSAGYKFFRRTNNRLFRDLRPHPLKGPYFQPMLLVSGYETINKNTVISVNGMNVIEEKDRTLAGSLVAVFGRQFVLWNILIFDSSFGVGIGYSRTVNVEPGNIPGEERALHFGFVSLDNEWSPTMLIRTSIGFLR